MFCLGCSSNRRKPQLHRDTAVPSADMGTRYNSHRSETWYELFYVSIWIAMMNKVDDKQALTCMLLCLCVME
jgi:hypothetical protein